MKYDTLDHRTLSDFCLEVSTLLHAGVSVADGLHLLADGETDQRLKELYTDLARQVDEGRSCAAAMGDTGAFPTYLCGLVEVGERSGRTEEALTSLSRFYQERERMERRVKSALLYPAVMLCLMLCVIGVLLVKVLPIFDDVYAALGSRLTGVAGGLLALGRALDRFMPAVWVILIALAAFVFCFSALPGFRNRVLAWWRGSRGDKGVAREMNNAQLVQAMSMGLRSGLSAEEAVGLAAGLMADPSPARNRCLACRAKLDEGMSLPQALRETGVLSAGDSRLLEVGEKGGCADAALERIAQTLSEDSQARLEELVARVEPALVLVCSVLVGLILLSVMLPLMHIMSAIG